MFFFNNINKKKLEKENLEKELILATDENNIQKVKRIFYDAIKNKIALNLNEKDENGW